MTSLVGSLLVAYYVTVGLYYLYRAGSGRDYVVTPGEQIATALITVPLVCLAVSYLAWWSR